MKINLKHFISLAFFATSISAIQLHSSYAAEKPLSEIDQKKIQLYDLSSGRGHEIVQRYNLSPEECVFRSIRTLIPILFER